MCLKNVYWKVFRDGSLVDDVKIADSIEQEDLLKKFDDGQYTAPNCSVGEEVCLSFMVRSEILVVLINRTSDVVAEHFKYKTSDEIFRMSVRNGVDYVLDYNDAKLKAENAGDTLTQDEYLQQVVADYADR